MSYHATSPTGPPSAVLPSTRWVLVAFSTHQGLMYILIRQREQRPRPDGRRPPHTGITGTNNVPFVSRPYGREGVAPPNVRPNDAQPDVRRSYTLDRGGGYDRAVRSSLHQSTYVELIRALVDASLKRSTSGEARRPHGPPGTISCCISRIFVVSRLLLA